MSDLKLKELENKVHELTVRCSQLEYRVGVLEMIDYEQEDELFIEFTPDESLLEAIKKGQDFKVSIDKVDFTPPDWNIEVGPYELGPDAAESGGGPLTTAEIHHFPGLCDADAKEDDSGK